MIKSKRIDIVVAIAVVFALTTSIALAAIGNIQAKNGGFKTELEYASRIFGSDIISIEIIADEDDWQQMLDSATSEQFIMADVIVNGTKFRNVGIRPKGNSSLAQVASSNSDRYSFRLQFDEYIDGQTCFGLESFVLNNMLGDNTYMKEYVSYDMMHEIGVDAPYFGFADIKVNGKDSGLYLAVELYNDSYEQRVFGDTSGMLYNVKSMDMGGNDFDGFPGGQGGNAPAMPGGGNIPAMPGVNAWQGFGQRQNNASRQWPGGQQDTQDNNTGLPSQNPEEQTDSRNNRMGMAFGGRGGFGRSGGSLEYIDDNTDSYGAIFNNVVGKGSEKDYQRVVKAIKALSEGGDLEKYFDVDKILRYLAAHTIVVNLDSYSSNMAQNYYIYERDGKITILPWDYNLAWGGFQGGGASSVINFPIDTPVSGVQMSERPLIDKLLANEEYLERYHSYLQQLIDNYFANGKFEEKINALDALISDYVKNDPTAFCTYEEYKAAVSAFITLGGLRAQSVQGQLDGTIPSTTAGQNADPSKLVSAGGLNLSALGSNMGGGRGGNFGFPGAMPGRQFGAAGQNNRQRTQTEGQQRADGQNNAGQQAQAGAQTAQPDGRQAWTDGQRAPFGNAAETLQRQQSNNFPGRFGAAFPVVQPLYSKSLITMGVLILVLIAAILFAKRLKRSY